jgi:hypothetical protein
MNPLDCYARNMPFCLPNTIAPYDAWFNTRDEYVRYERKARRDLPPEERVKRPTAPSMGNYPGGHPGQRRQQTTHQRGPGSDNWRNQSHQSGDWRQSQRNNQDWRERQGQHPQRTNQTPRQPRPEEPPREVVMRERMCNNVLRTGHCRYRQCNFAHHANELDPAVCKYRNRCRNRDNCTFIHPSETKEDFIDRLAHIIRAGQSSTR